MVRTRGFLGLEITAPKIDVNDDWHDKNKNAKDGIPVPGYVEAGGRIGEYGSLSFFDAPYAGEYNDVTFYFETCAICNCNNNDVNLGCFSFTYTNRKHEFNVKFLNGQYEVKAKKPTSLWKNAVKNWENDAGTNFKGEK